MALFSTPDEWAWPDTPTEDALPWLSVVCKGLSYLAFSISFLLLREIELSFAVIKGHQIPNMTSNSIIWNVEKKIFKKRVPSKLSATKSEALWIPFGIPTSDPLTASAPTVGWNMVV